MNAIIAAVVGPIVALAVAGLVGNELAARSERRRKLRDLDLDLLHEFYRLYGEFFALLKLWDAWKRRGNSAATDPDGFGRILERSANAEGRVEALLLKVASERTPTCSEQDLLGAFRQCHQSLRESVGRDEAVEWNRANFEPYAAFKALACAVSQLLSSERSAHWDQLEPREAIDAFRQVTSNTYEGGRPDRPDGPTPWVTVATRMQLVAPHQLNRQRRRLVRQLLYAGLRTPP